MDFKVAEYIEVAPQGFRREEDIYLRGVWTKTTFVGWRTLWVISLPVFKKVNIKNFCLDYTIHYDRVVLSQGEIKFAGARSEAVNYYRNMVASP